MYVSAATMFPSSDLVPFDLTKRAAECEKLEEMSDEMRDLLTRSCAAYGVTFPPKAKKQRTTQEEEGSGRSHLPDPTPLAAIPAPALSGLPPPTASAIAESHSECALGAAC